MVFLIELDGLCCILGLGDDFEIRAIQFIGQHDAAHAGVVDNHDLDLFHKCSPAFIFQKINSRWLLQKNIR